MERGQVSDQVRSAPGVVGVDQVLVAGVAVADDGAGVAGQDLPVVDVVLRTAAGVHRGQELGGGDVDVLQPTSGADRGLIGSQHSHRVEQLPDPGQELSFEQSGGAAAHRGHEPGRGRDAQHRGHQPGGPPDGQVVGAQQLRRPAQHPRPVLGPPGRDRGCRARGAGGTTRAGPGEDPVLGEPLPSSVEELAALVEQLRVANAGLREVIAGQAMQLEAQAQQLAAQAEQIAQLRQRLGKDSATSSNPPSSDPPYRKPERRSSRRSSGA